MPDQQNKPSLTYNPNVKEVHSLSSSILENNGWIKKERLTWVKQGDIITFDGSAWVLNKKTKLQFWEDIK